MQTTDRLTHGTYGRLPYIPDNEELKGYDYAIVGVPYDFMANNRPGGRRGPSYIRENSRMGRYDIESGTDLFRAKGADSGNVNISPGDEPSNFKEMHEKFTGLLDNDLIPIVLGGDRSITYHELKAFYEKYGKAALVLLSGHSAMYPFRHFPDSSSVIFSALKDGFIDAEHSVQVGTREPLTSETTYAVAADGLYYQDGVRVISTYEIRERGYDAVALDISSLIGDLPVLFAFSPDFADPAFAPAVVDPVSDGFTSYQTIAFIRTVLKKISPKQFDITDFSPVYDEGRITQVFASDIVNLFITSIAEKKGE